MSEVKDVIISPCSETVIAEAESVASSVNQELIDRMSENYEDIEVYEEPYHFTRGTLGPGSNGVETDEQWLNAPEHINSGVYYNTFGGGPEGGFFQTNFPNALYSLERTWGTKFKWTAVLDRELERQLYKTEDTFLKDGLPHIRIWKKCPTIVFKESSDFGNTACSPIGYKKLNFPFFLMGSPGVKEALTINWSLQRPKAINQAFLLRVAVLLEKEPFRDWDWQGFRDNLILPNFDHIQILNRITDPKIMSRWVYDLNVFLNCGKEKDIVERKRGKPNKIHLVPSLKNLNNPADIEY